jgi:replicative DNA helicase
MANAPINVAAERSILGALLENDALFPDVEAAGLQVEDFALSDHRRVFRAMLTLRKKGVPVDCVTVAEWLGNRQEDYVLVASLIHGVIIEEDHVIYHVRIVQRKAKLRALKKIGEWLMEAAVDCADPDVLIPATIGKIERAHSVGVSLEL